MQEVHSEMHLPIKWDDVLVREGHVPAQFHHPVKSLLVTHHNCGQVSEILGHHLVVDSDKALLVVLIARSTRMD